MFWRVRAVALRPRSGPSRAESRGGGRLRLIALIDEAAVIERILRHLGLPTELPASQPGRALALGVARAVLSHVEGRPSRSTALPGATAGTRPSCTRAPHRRPERSVTTREPSASLINRVFAGGLSVRGCTCGQPGAARLRRRTSAGQCCPRGHNTPCVWAARCFGHPAPSRPRTGLTSTRPGGPGRPLQCSLSSRPARRACHGAGWLRRRTITLALPRAGA
jgi:hypothetical protein